MSNKNVHNVLKKDCKIAILDKESLTLQLE